MLQLKNIKKVYVTSSERVEALRGVSISFRKTEFVSILGPSGCGKTTLLNIIGGLDQYTEGDLLISGRSTKSYTDRDWDVYRNHKVGFIFQSYNLIPHQTVLGNVELALTIAGIGKEERVRRAKEALDRVGLAGQYYKRPNQLSGGQCQRVAIARALVNDPEILLADEPTGALDTVTSVQIMELVKDIARERLVIMVTHNPELAEEYSTRIVRLLDGNVTEDSNPMTDTEALAEEKLEREAKEKEEAELLALGKKEEKRARREKRRREEKAKMSFPTAFMLSLKNLFTKKGRSTLTAFAGSIGIIGIALIIAFSSGINAFIAQVQKDTLSTYPLTINRYTQDMSAMLAAMTQVSDAEDYRDSGMIYVDDSLGTMMSAMNSTVENNLTAFREYIENNRETFNAYVSDIQYVYDYDLQIYTADGKVKVGFDTLFSHMGTAFSGMSELMKLGSSMSVSVFSEMIDNRELLDQQYDIVDGSWPSNANEVVLVVNSNNQISKMALYMLGILDPANIEKDMEGLMSGNYEPTNSEPYAYSDFIGMEFKLLTTADFFEKNENRTYTANGGTVYNSWDDIRNHPGYSQESFVTSSENALTLKISGIIRPKPGATATSISGAVGYTRGLTDYILTKNAESEVINQQKATPDYNVLTGLPFERTKYTPETIDELINKIDGATMDMFYQYMTEMILTNPDFADRINATDAETFIGMYMLLPDDKQAEMFAKVLEAASSTAEGASKVKMLCKVLSLMTGDIEVTPANIVKLLPILDVTHVAVALMGVPQEQMPPTMPMPIAIPGLIELAGDRMTSIYGEINDIVKNLEVNEDIFITILSTLSADDPAFIQLEETLYSMAPQIDATYESVLSTLDDAEKAAPYSINFFAKDFESKEAIETLIADYNAAAEDKDKLEYSDLVGTLMSSVTTIVNAISYVLIAFVAVSLIVSSIMIGVITLISVQERTKEIGVLRAIGASKKDVSSMFNAETIIIGLAAGLIGVIVTYLTCIPINIILHALTGIANLDASLPIGAALILVAISVILTLFSGLIPSRSAAKKDPVVALRTE